MNKLPAILDNTGSATSKLFFEDINVGDSFIGAKIAVDRDRMISFAKEFDNQLMHTDATAAKAMGLDDVIASGSYTFPLAAKSCTDIWERLHFLPSGLGFQMSFVKPVYEGDELQLNAEVINARPSRDPSRGVLEIKQAFLNQNGESVLDLENVVWLIRTRDPR